MGKQMDIYMKEPHEPCMCSKGGSHTRRWYRNVYFLPSHPYTHLYSSRSPSATALIKLDVAFLFTTVPMIDTGNAGSVRTDMTNLKPSAIMNIIGSCPPAAAPAPVQPASFRKAERRLGSAVRGVVRDTWKVGRRYRQEGQNKGKAVLLHRSAPAATPCALY